MSYLLTQDDALAEFTRRGGGKAMNLAQMSQRAVRVPPWFCVAVDAFDAFVKRHQLQSALNATRHLDRLADFAEDVVGLFLSFPLPDDVEADVRAQLSAMHLEESLLAVRSSGIDEDSAGHSFAGLFSSCLCQRGDAAISESIRRCWASGFSERAIAYRIERGLTVAGIRVGVVIQAMVEPVAAGVAFSRDPVHPLDRSHLVIDAVFGLGEGLVSGELDADHFLVDRQTLRIDHRAVADKRTAVRYGAGSGVVREPLDARTSRQPSISDEQARRVATEVLALERAIGTPQDTEWVIDGQGQLYIVQTRPVSTLPVDAFFDAAVNGREATLWDNSNIIESYSGVTSPLTFSFANAAYRRVYVQFCEVMGVPRRDIAAHDSMYRNMLGLVRGHVYYNLINWYRLIQMLPFAGSSRGFMETMMGVKQELSPELAALFAEKKLALLANVGTLGEPTTRAQYNAGLRPMSLYSHSDQQAQWQSAISNAAAGTGWGGRLADVVATKYAASSFPVVTSLDGTVLYATGATTVPLAIPVSGSFALAGYDGSSTASARLAARQQLQSLPSANTFVRAASAIGAQALELSATVNPILANTNSAIAPLFSGLTTNTARQLYQVAKMIEARAATGAQRQIFFVQLGSFDTHSEQANRQQALFAELAPALKAFYDATVALGIGSQVTTFTLSDFGRTLQPASGGGTDHAWGSHHFILGDAVRGGSLYGQYPQLVLGGPDDAEKEGRWIPTTAVEQYGATLARWFGATSADLATVFPNLARFPTSDVGFMS